MSKIVIAVIFALMVSSFAMSYDDAKNLIEKDSCAVKTMELLEGQIQAKAAQLKEDENNQELKDELSALFEKAKNIYSTCQQSSNIRTEPVLGDPVKAAGIGFLLASNCFKDIGAVLLIFDSIVQDPKNVTNDVIVLIFVYILGRQGVADCGQLIHYIH